MPIIFTSGSCLKNELFDIIIAAMVSAGWENVSSLASSDFIVMKSTGVNSDKSLCFQIRATNTSNTNSVISTDYCTASLRFIDTYIPGDTGVAGTVGRISAGWWNLPIVPVVNTTTLSGATTLNYKLYTDKNRVMVAIEYPPATGYSPLFWMIGLPDTVQVPETGNKGLIFATTSYATTSANIYINDNPDGLGSAAAAYAMPTYTVLSPKNPNNANKYAMSEVYYGSTTEGIRGTVDGVYLLPITNSLTGDIIEVGAEEYYTLICQSYGSNSFSSLGLAIRTL